MATMTVRFVTESDLVSALIREKTWCPYSHCEFVLDDGTALGARASGGVQIRPINYAKFSAEARFTVEMTNEQKFIIETFAKAQIGKSYDFGAIAGNLLHVDWRSHDRWDCSQLLAAAFEQAFPLIRIPSEFDGVTPRDLLMSVLLTPLAFERYQ